MLGYSVKSRGIARDLFGTEEHYVVPVQQLTQPDDLINAFCWIWEHEDSIRDVLSDSIPDYIQKAQKLSANVKSVLEMK